MAKRSPKRDEAKALYLSKKGKIQAREIAKRLDISPKMVSNWKYRDQWESCLKKQKKKGGQPGNKNARNNCGGGAPKNNTNAQTHGAYSYPRIEEWTEEERRQIAELEMVFSDRAEDELRMLWAKQHDLERKIQEIDEEILYLDRLMTMEIPGGKEMKYRSESSGFSRRMVLEGELNRVQGRIAKILDAIRCREDAEKRLEFEREKFQFAKEKTMGVFGNGEDEDTDSVEIVE